MKTIGFQSRFNSFTSHHIIPPELTDFWGNFFNADTAIIFKICRIQALTAEEFKI